MFGNATEFVWQRPRGASGFEFRPSESGQELPLVAARAGATFEDYTPLLDESALFLIFSETEPTAEGVLRFANVYGRLGDDVLRYVGPHVSGNRGSWEQGDLVELVISHIRQMREAVVLRDLIDRRDRRGLARHFRWVGPDEVHRQIMESDATIPIATRTREPEVFAAFKYGDLLGPARYWLDAKVNACLRGHVVLKLLRLGAAHKDQIVLDLLPDSLLAALWLQLALAIAGGKQYRRCRLCGKPFELSPRVNRVSRLTCSAACRNLDYRNRQERARELHGQGKAFSEIAAELGSNVKTVRGWVKTKSRG
jgi:hypothetical protein